MPRMRTYEGSHGSQVNGARRARLSSLALRSWKVKSRHIGCLLSIRLENSHLSGSLTTRLF